MNRTSWIDGEWMREPNALTWDYNGVQCFIVRHYELGHLCGYIEVPVSHPWHRKTYFDIEASVHGGLTYSEDGLPKPFNGLNESWYIGFDCAHAGDMPPGIGAMLPSHMKILATSRGKIYRNLGYVLNEVQSLADQMIAAGVNVNLTLLASETPQTPSTGV